MPVKYEQTFVDNFYKSNGCKLLDIYKNNRTKMNFICRCGKIYCKSFESFSKFPRCRKCGHEAASKKKTYTQLEVSEYFKIQGCQLLGEYKGITTPVEYKCVCGIISNISFDNFKKGKRCKKCGRDKYSGELHPGWIKNREDAKLRKLIRKKCYKALRSSLKKLDIIKDDRTNDLLGYTSQELYDWLKQHSNWEDVKNSKWHLDHIFPIKAFIDYGILDLKIINCLENLQPLLAKDNLVKSDSYFKEDFLDWLNKKGINVGN